MTLDAVPSQESVDGLIAADKAHLVHPLTRQRAFLDDGPVLVVGGRGSEVQLADGRWLIDGSAGLWCVNAGHGRAELAEAAAKQMNQVAFTPTFGTFSNIPAIELSERLAELAPGDLDGVMFTSGGSESNETAIKLARFYWSQLGKPEKSVVISHDRGYHGLGLATTAATGLKQYHPDFGPLSAGHAYAPSPYCYRCAAGTPCDQATCAVDTGQALADTINEIGADHVAAVIVEPVLGTGGVIVPPPGYLRAVRDVCTRLGVLMIADEVITGFCRTGRWFGVEHDGVVPDMLTFAKGVTSGYVPLGGVLIGGAVRQALQSVPDDHALMHGFTYSGHPVTCAVALANIDILEQESLAEAAAQRGKYLLTRLETLRSLPHVGDVRGLGLMTAVEVVADKDTGERFPAAGLARTASVAKSAREFGLVTRPLLDDILLLAPPLVITEAECDRAVEALAASIERIAAD
jgi:adenosylmethionine-8-amino-7-oxononanoate aminotransferase